MIAAFIDTGGKFPILMIKVDKNTIVTSTGVNRAATRERLARIVDEGITNPSKIAGALGVGKVIKV